MLMQVVHYFVVITGTVNDVNNSIVIYMTSSNVSFCITCENWTCHFCALNTRKDN